MIEYIRKWELSGCLDFSHQNVREIRIKEHDVLSKLLDSTSLDLSDNQLSQFPAFISKLSNLECINLSFNHISCISDVAFVKLTLVTVLDLSFNHLTCVPASLCDLTSLKVLLLQHNQICHITENISHLKSVSHLDLSHNIIPSLPEQLCEIQSLKTLLLADNILLELPKGLHHLQVEKLDISNNRIVELPQCVIRMQCLKVLSCHGNPLIHPPVEKVHLGLPHVQKYLSDWEFTEKLPTFFATDSLSPVQLESCHVLANCESPSRQSCPCESGCIHSQSVANRSLVKAVSIDSQRRKSAWRDLKRRSCKTLRQRSTHVLRGTNLCINLPTNVTQPSDYYVDNSSPAKCAFGASNFSKVNNDTNSTPTFVSSPSRFNSTTNHNLNKNNKFFLDSIEEVNDAGDHGTASHDRECDINGSREFINQSKHDQINGDDTVVSEASLKLSLSNSAQKIVRNEQQLILGKMKETIFSTSDEPSTETAESISMQETCTHLRNLLLRHVPSRIIFTVQGSVPHSPSELSQSLSDCVLLYRWLENQRPGLLPEMEPDSPSLTYMPTLNSLQKSESRVPFVVRKRKFLKRIEALFQSSCKASNTQTIEVDHKIRLRRATCLLNGCKEINVPEMLLCTPEELIHQPSLNTLLKLCEGIAFATRVPLMSDVIIAIFCALILLCTLFLLNYLPLQVTA